MQPLPLHSGSVRKHSIDTNGSRLYQPTATYTTVNKLLLTFEVIVDAVRKECARRKVDKSDVVRLCVNKNVFVLDVSVYNAGVVQSYSHLHDLSEQPANLVLKTPALSDMVKQVLSTLRSLHHQYEAVRLFQVVHQLDHAWYARCTLQQTDLDR